MRAELYAIQGIVGSFKCTKKRCEVCKNVNITESFIYSITENTYKINHKLTCDDKYLNYIFNCKQYVGNIENVGKST